LIMPIGIIKPAFTAFAMNISIPPRDEIALIGGYVLDCEE